MPSPAPITRELADFARSLRFTDLSADVVTVAKHCLLDWLGVTIAGSREPLAVILRDALDPDEAGGDATLIGCRPARTTSLLAALVNGATGHALDFDDTHWTMNGHPSVPVMPAALALAEELGRSGSDLLTAIVAGIETECRLGAVMGRRHYAAGFHATGTLGTLGAASACAWLLGLDPEAWCHALGLAGTQAAGLKSSFGSMAKPLHAGKAAHDGLLSARLAAGGFTGNPRIIESRQGLAHTLQGGEPDLEALARCEGRFLIRETLFKYHAACYLTQSAIEGARRIRESTDVSPADVAAVEIHVPPSSLDVCNIQAPVTGLEGKFSLRATAALALLGDATGALETYRDDRMRDTDLIALRDRVAVVPVDGIDPMATPVRVRTAGGTEHDACIDVGRPAEDLDEQGRRLEAKFRALATPTLGAAATQNLLGAVFLLDRAPELASVLDAACAPAGAAL